MAKEDDLIAYRETITPYKITSPKNFLSANRYSTLEKALEEFSKIEGQALLTIYNPEINRTRFIRYKEQ
ncbi:hypothetical protein [Sphingobacterium spiritivorum]|uniref:hypothetical protein n=1 Tax=Sphingobacterium spiritivorum TaxID=258 RepID=UPI003DA1F5ED